MRLRPGVADEYRRRHDDIWPELAEFLKRAGVRDYSIHLDERDGVTLFAVLTETVTGGVDALADDPLMRRWWHHMADLMDTDAEGRPRTWPLTRMFNLL